MAIILVVAAFVDGFVVVGSNFRWVALAWLPGPVPRSASDLCRDLPSHRGRALSCRCGDLCAVSTIVGNIAILIWGGGYSGLPGGIAGAVRFSGSVNWSSISRWGRPARSRQCRRWWMLEIHRFGREVAVGSRRRRSLRLISGISIERVRVATFCAGNAMAGVAGVLVSTRLRHHRPPTRITLHHQGIRGDHRRRDGQLSRPPFSHSCCWA